MAKQLARAPALYHEGKSTEDRSGRGFGMISHDLYRAIMAQTSGKDGALRSVIIYFLLQKGDGSFFIPEETILDNCNINHGTYVRARSKLKEMGWIEHKEGECIIVKIDNILKGVSS